MQEALLLAACHGVLSKYHVGQSCCVEALTATLLCNIVVQGWTAFSLCQCEAPTPKGCETFATWIGIVEQHLHPSSSVLYFTACLIYVRHILQLLEC